MNLVNVLFWSAILLSQDLIQLIAYGCWIAYLIYCIRRSSSKIVTVVYGLFLVFADAMVIGGGYTLVTYEEEPTRVYAFRGENDQFAISNGVRGIGRGRCFLWWNVVGKRNHRVART